MFSTSFVRALSMSFQFIFDFRARGAARNQQNPLLLL